MVRRSGPRAAGRQLARRRDLVVESEFGRMRASEPANKPAVPRKLETVAAPRIRATIGIVTFGQVAPCSPRLGLKPWVHWLTHRWLAQTPQKSVAEFFAEKTALLQGIV